MLKVVGCFVGAHDLWLVALAATICTLAAITAVELLRHARKATQKLRGGSVCLNSDLGLDKWIFCRVQAAAGCGSLSK